MKRSRPLNSTLKEMTSAKSKGFTLAELLVAMSMVPIVLLSASAVCLYTTKAMNEVAARSQAASEKQLVLETLERYIPNANEADLDVVDPFDPDTPGDAFHYELDLTVPGISGEHNIFRFMKAAGAEEAATLSLCHTTDPADCSDDSDWTQISYRGHSNTAFIQPVAGKEPIAIEGKKVNFNFTFKTPDQDNSFLASSSVEMRGGTGI